MKWLYAFQSLFIAANLFGGLFLKGVRVATNSHGVPYAWYSRGGPFFFLFTADYSTLMMVTAVVMFRKAKAAEGAERQRIQRLLAAICIIVFFGTNDILPILGIYNYPLTTIPVYPLGSLAAIFYGIIAAHTILQHQLLDIHVTLGRIAAKSVRLGFLLVICLVLLLIVHTLYPQYLPKAGFFLALGAFTVSSVIASNFFPRLFGGGTDTLERRILGDRFEYQDKIQGFIQTLPWYTDTNSLMDDFDELLVKTVKVQKFSLVMLDETTRKFTDYRSFPRDESGAAVTLERESPVFKYFYQTKEDMLAINSERRPPIKNELQRLALERLEPSKAEFCYCFYSEDDPFGFLLLGRKVSDEPYTANDMNLLRSVVRNLSLILNQIRLKQRILVTEEMELLGRMSRGMAHDLNNLITPVSTYVQLARESAREEDASYELLPTAARNVETIQSYIKESLFYSNTLKPHFAMGRLDRTVERAIQLVGPQLKERKIFVVAEPFPEANIEFDSVLVQRMICNLLGNAGDASPDGGEIRVTLSRLPRTESSREWFRLRIIDSGSGISKENLRNVFQPFFTTKDRGSGKRGFGLGLAICKKIVVLHGGNLNLESEEKVGTTAVVDLPEFIQKTMDKPKPVMTHSQAA